MRILVIDKNVEYRTTLVSRVHSAYLQAGLKRAQILDGSLSSLGVDAAKGAPELVFLGPGYYQSLEDSIARVRSVHPTAPLAVVLDNDIYAAEAVELRKTLSVRIMPLADIAQMAQFILDARPTDSSEANDSTRGVIGVCHLKGGVGGSTVANALAGCWARHDLSVVILDLDDVNPQQTDWAGVPKSARATTAELLLLGDVPQRRVQELAYSLEHLGVSLSVVGQPELYSEGFHCKADVIHGAPSSAHFIEALIPALRQRFDVVVIDLGNAWGISSFASLPCAEHILMVTDEEITSVRRSMEVFARLHRESDDPAEFNLSRWSVVLNRFTGTQLQPEEVAVEIAAVDLFPETVDLFTIPYVPGASAWSLQALSYFDLLDEEMKEIIREVAFSLVPFRYQPQPKDDSDLVGKLRKGIKSLVGA